MCAGSTPARLKRFKLLCDEQNVLTIIRIHILTLVVF